ncbi:MAG TPA: glycosyltransferase family 39 protein [Rhodothermia bacterium]|nr:glycosyltransferase family 39 protein [Rhodothermia bacterium]
MLLTLAAISLHVMAATSGGGLWRDEANTVGLATLPELRDVWDNLPSDSFPMLWLLIIRAFSAVFGQLNDPAFRVLGFVVGVGVVGALWLNARTFRHSLPLISLALIGLSPSMIRWGDTVRAYGFGILLILVTCALLWRFLERPGVTRFAATAAAAIASVNVLYYNAVLLLAFCAGAVAVCVHRRRWKQAAAVVLVGVLAAISLAPYAPTILRMGQWTAVVRMPDYTLGWFWTKLNESLGPGGPWTLAVWSALLALSVAAGLLAVGFPKRLALSESRREVVLFSLVSLLVGVPGNYLFLKTLSYYTNPWYYLALLALTALCIDALLGALIQTRGVRIARIAGTLLLLTATIIPTRRAVRTRLTDVDLVAARLEAVARPGDLVLVSPWHYGVSFNRYYHGAAAWMTVPPLAFHRFVRYDLLVDNMTMPDQTAPVRPVRERAEEVLRSGHRVFVVGLLLFPVPGHEPPVLPPARPRTKSLPEGDYQNQWLTMVGDFIQRHAAGIAPVSVEADRVVSRYENLSIQVVEGWRP